MLESIKTLFWVSRPISWVNTAYPFAAAYLVTGGRNPALLVIGTLYFLIPYNLMMYGINDVFDYASDILNPRKGGIEGAVSGRQHHRLILLASIILSLPFVVYLLTIGPTSSKIWLSYAIFMVLAYSAPHLRFKERPVLDSFTSATHFVSPMVYGLLLTGIHVAAWPAVTAFFMWGMASHAFGAVQDIVPDRAGGVQSLATILGIRATLLIVCSLYGLSALLLLAYGWAGVLVALAVLPYLQNAARFFDLTDATSGQANAGWRRFLWLNWIAGFVVTMVLIGSKLA